MCWKAYAMTNRLSIRMTDPVQARKALDGVIWMHLKANLVAGNRMTVEVKPEVRSLAENALLHALLTEISNSVEWAGQKRDPEVWKRLLTAAWLRTRGEGVEILPAVDGHGIDVVFRRTSSLTRAECAELIEFAQCWAVEHGVKFKAVEQ